MLQAQIYIDKDDLQGSKLLSEFIMEFLIRHGVAGATSFRGQTGFGPNQHLKRPDTLFSFDEPPMMITFIDEDEKVKAVLTELRKALKGGFIVTSKVEKW